jgi:hypothetical protein
LVRWVWICAQSLSIPPGTGAVTGKKAGWPTALRLPALGTWA